MVIFRVRARARFSTPAPDRRSPSPFTPSADRIQVNFGKTLRKIDYLNLELNTFIAILNLASVFRRVV
jgi:hypothetical protein